MGLKEDVKYLEERLANIEGKFENLNTDSRRVVQSELKKSWIIPAQSESQFGLFTALVVDTVDPLKQNRVRFFSPLFHNPDTPVDSLPFANPISSMGGFDDCGLSWTPPAGSTLCIVFENGSRNSPFYIGTTWHRYRGPINDGGHIWNYNIDEYYKIHAGHRKGYLLGSNDESQVFPPWNTESYNGIDIDSVEDFEDNEEALKNITYPNIYGFKTPQKHMFKMVDGNYECNHRNKRIEILSSGGNHLIFKDDNLHDVNSIIKGKGGEDCFDEKTECVGENSNPDLNKGGNPYFKNENEQRPFIGPRTPQNNRCDLDQTGIQLLSISGHTLKMDDSVDQPRGIPEWEKSLQPFDFGCNDVYKGKLLIKSSTGHLVELNDEELDTGIRNENNGIRFKTALGNSLELNDHSITEDIAGERRGVKITSTSNHTIELNDKDNEQSAPTRREGGIPVSRSKSAFVRIRSGYGIEILMDDNTSQENTENQSFRIICPQKDNDERGSHLFIMQERESGPGQILLRAGGDIISVSYDNQVLVAGDIENNPSNIITQATRHNINIAENFYIASGDVDAILAKKIILLMAGEDCVGKNGDPGPCPAPVLVMTSKGISISDRVFASASDSAPCVSIFHLTPFHQCGG